MTIREAVRAYHGGFYNRLVDVHLYQERTNESKGEICSPVIALAVAFDKADARHRAALRAVFPGIEAVATTVLWKWPLDLRAGLERAFPGLTSLDHGTDNPTDFDLLEEQP